MKMAIWKNKLSLAAMNAGFEQTLVRHLGIEVTEIGDDYVKAKMPVDQRTHQPFGLLHGGASVALAETMGSMAGQMCVEPGHTILGVEINANHVRGVRDGYVHAIAKPLHLGRTTQVWDIRIHDDNDKLVCISRLTVAVAKIPT